MHNQESAGRTIDAQPEQQQDSLMPNLWAIYYFSRGMKSKHHCKESKKKVIRALSMHRNVFATTVVLIYAGLIQDERLSHENFRSKHQNLRRRRRH